MKYFYTFIASLLFVSGSFSLGVQASPIDEVIAAIKSGNVVHVASFFDNTVEITMPDKSNSYSRSQAELVLKDFFNTYAAKGFDVIHKGISSGSQYCIGTLRSKNGGYRTTIFMKQKGDALVIQELRFENR